MYGRYPSQLPAMLILGGAAAWGLLWLPLRYMEAQGLADGWAALSTFLWPALAILPLVWRQRRTLAGHWQRIFAFGLAAGLAFALYTIGLVYSAVVRVTLLFYLTPVWSALFAMLLLKETTRWSGWLAALAGLVGLGLMLGSVNDNSEPLNIGDAYAFASGLLWAFAVIVLRRHPDIPPVGTVAAQYVFAAIFLLAICLSPLEQAPWPDARSWLVGAAVLGSFGSAVLLPGLFGIFWAAGRLPPARVGVLMMTEVLVAVVSATLMTNERMGVLEWTGAAMIIAAALLELAAGGDGGSRRSRR